RRRAAAVRELQSAAQVVARVAPLVAAPQRRAQVDERARQLEPRRRALEHLDRLLQAREAGAAAADEAPRAQRHADGPRRAPRAGELDLLVDEGQRAVPLVEC